MARRTIGDGGAKPTTARVRLLPVQYVRPYVRRNKTDRTDTEALLEAASVWWDAPRAREDRGAANARRHSIACARSGRRRGPRASTRCEGMLRESRPAGRLSARGRRLTRIPALLEDADDRAARICVRHTVALVVARSPGRLRHASPPIDQQLTQVVARRIPSPVRLQQIPGVGVHHRDSAGRAPSNHIHAFRRGRQFASWLGLTPRESSTGGRRHLGRISKRGDVYLRCLLTHGARAVLLTAQRTARAAPQQRDAACSSGPSTVAARRGHNKAAIARREQAGSDHLGGLAP